MANIKISQLPLIMTPTLTDLYAVVQGGVTYRETMAQLQTLMGFSAGILPLANGGTSASLTASLGSLAYSTASAMAFTSPLANGQLAIGSNGAAPTVSNLTAGTGVSIANGPGSITISTTGGGITWNVINGTSANLSSNSGYIANNNFLVTLTLPMTANPGDVIQVVGLGTGLFRIAQNAGQAVHFLSQDTTIGVSGHIDSTSRYDSLQLVCVVTNTEFSVITSMGNLSIT